LAWKVLGAARTRAPARPPMNRRARHLPILSVRGDPIESVESIERTAFKGARSPTAHIAVVIDRAQSAVADFLTSATVGPSGLVVEGEAGIGKTTLWLAGVEHARKRGFRVLSAQPAEAESVQAYASLADLLDGIEPAAYAELPEPQCLAIDQVLLRSDADTPATDQRAVAAAFLSVLGRLADETPVLLAIDDLQWLDPSTVHVVAFAVRRLSGPVGVFGAERTDPASGTTVSWLRPPRPDAMRRLQVPPLSMGGLHQVLSKRLGRTFPRPTMSRVHQISGGNPFYAIELARAIQGDATLSEAALPGNLAQLVQRRIGSLDSDVQQALLAAASAPAPTVELVARATGTDAAGVMEFLEAAESGGIIAIAGQRLRFAHPLLAHGVYTGASAAQRRRMHRRLADIVTEPELQARHLALAATRGDPLTLKSLDTAAEIARSRGAPAAAAELLDLAIGLGGDTPERRIRSANHHHDAGDVGRARVLLEQTIQEQSPGILRAEALNLLGLLHMASDGGNLEARDCFELALGEVGDHLALRVQILTNVSFCYFSMADLTAAVPSAEDAVIHGENLGEPQLLSRALSVRVLLGAMHGDGIDEDRMRRALELEDRSADAHALIRPSMQNVVILACTGRLDEACREALTLQAHSRDRGEETQVIVAALYYAFAECYRGNLLDSIDIAEDAMERALQMGGDQPLIFGLTARASAYAYAGRVDEARRDIAAALAASHRSGAAFLAGVQLTALGFLEVSLGNYDAALSALAPLVAMVEAAPDATEIVVGAFIPDAVEAFVGLGRVEEAAPLLAALERNGHRLDRPWMLAVGGRCRAVVLAAQGDLDSANVAAQQAMTAHDRLPMPFERARTQLLVGQLHRRARQKDAAAVALREALLAFVTMGTPLWAERVRVELDRVDVGPRQTAALTPSERRVAELTATGMTNRDVAAALFISPKTVEANLSRVYHKLGIRSRAELGRHVGEPEGRET
jgi:DNA-binding CsgD family transcriptional regulator/tetratricopeptide (TPR) repeat protein